MNNQILIIYDFDDDPTLEIVKKNKTIKKKGNNNSNI